MASHGFIKILSNDGSETLVSDMQVDVWEPVISVTSTGLKQGTVINYVYSGNKKFLGVSTTPNATEPTYAVGGEYTLPRIESAVTFSLYIVEGEANTPTITDLTNTTWYIPSGWSITRGYGTFILSYEFNGLTVDEGYAYFGFAVTSDGLESASNSIYIGNTSLTPSNDFAIKIIGGLHSTNPGLISWLETYGIQLKVTDLTNTSWYVPAGWEAEAGYGKFNVTGDGEYQNGNPIYIPSEGFCVGYSFRTDGEPPFNMPELHSQANTFAIAWDSDIPNTEVFVVNFTGGTDTTNPKLIAWLSKYGELQDRITDLTGYTVTVPSGWTAPLGNSSTVFGSIGYTVINANTNQVIIDASTEHGDGNYYGTICFGYSGMALEPMPTVNSIVFVEMQSMVGYSINNNVALRFTFTGGLTYVYRLIQWFYDNNATFTKTEEPEQPEQPTTPKKKFTKLIPETLAEGTAIMPGTTPKYIYFNSNNHYFKTLEALSQLTYVQTDLFEFPISIICGLVFNDRPNNPVAIGAVKIPQENIVSEVLPHNGYYYQIIYVFLGYEMWTLFDSTASDWTETNNGFTLNNNDPLVLCHGKMVYCTEGMLGSVTPLTDFNGLPIGAENEKIKNVLSTTPFVVNINSSEANTSGIIGTSWQELVDGGYIIIGANGLSTLYDGDEDNLSKIKIAGELVIPYIDGVTAIDDNGFKWMETLTKVTIPDGISMLSDSAFAYCNNLQNVTLPKTLITIGGECFNSCTRLENIVIPNEVGEIMDDAFVGCWRLTNITFEGTMEQWNNIRFGERWNEYVPATYVQCTDGQVYLTE